MIIVLLVLLAISVAAAAVAPQRDASLGGDTTTTTAPEGGGTTQEPPDDSETIEATIAASTKDPPEVRAVVGDRVVLLVSTTSPLLQVEIADLGLIDEATAEAPAQFELLLREAGTLAVSDAESDDVVGVVVVDAPSSRRPDRRSPEADPNTR